MATLKNQKKSEIMETLTVNPDTTNANEVLVETQEIANVPDAPEVSKTLTPDEITAQIKIAKKELAIMTIEFDGDEENPEIIAKEKQISEMATERERVVKELAKQKLENEFNEKLTLAKNDICDKFGIANELLETLITNSKDVKDSLKASFAMVFGKMPVFVSENTTGKTLTKSNAKSSENGSVNITKSVKELLSAGTDATEIVNFILTNSDMDETKAKKRLNDIKWGWEIENGLREKPKK